MPTTPAVASTFFCFFFCLTPLFLLLHNGQIVENTGEGAI